MKRPAHLDIDARLEGMRLVVPRVVTNGHVALNALIKVKMPDGDEFEPLLSTWPERQAATSQ